MSKATDFHVSALDLKEIKREVEQDVVITGPKAALFLLALVKEKGKGCRTVKSLVNKLKLDKGYELTMRKRREPL